MALEQVYVISGDWDAGIEKPNVTGTSSKDPYVHFGKDYDRRAT